MTLERRRRRILETELVDRRVLGAFQFVDAATGLPVAAPTSLAVLGGRLRGSALDAVSGDTVRLTWSRRGVWVITRAPLFDAYTSQFLEPQLPVEVQAPGEPAPSPLRLRFAVTDAGPDYLPQEFAVELPRNPDPAAENSVFQPVTVRLLRAPVAPVLDGWVVLRVQVTQRGVTPLRPLGGVLISVYRHPRRPGDTPIGLGMSEWRGAVAGEALVPLLGIERFRPGAGNNVIEASQAIEFVVARHAGFTGADGTQPDTPALLAGTGEGLIEPPSRPASARLDILRPPDITPAAPMRVQAGKQYVVHLAMP